MLFYQNLDNIIFNRHQLFQCDELVVISGYVGPKPIYELEKLPIKSTVIYGMYGNDGIRESLHKTLVSANNALQNVDILYSELPVHSKCYIWKNKGEVVHSLIGSANFSINGLTTPFKEVLAETTFDTFAPLLDYQNMILNKAISCNDAISRKNKRKSHDGEDKVYDKDICSMPLYIEKEGKLIVPDQSGLNWGMAKKTGAHVNINDAYIRIGSDLIENYPELFPKKQDAPTKRQGAKKGHRHNDCVDIIWDDGTTMTGLLEGSLPKEINGVKGLYPKQISTSPRKSELGKYLRNRLGVPEGVPITYSDLTKYGRTTVDVSLQAEGIYYFDFSVEK